MAYVSPGPPTPRAPTPKVRAMREIMRAFGQLPIDHELAERNDFRTLFRIIEDTVVEDNLLRTAYIEFLRAGEIQLQVRFIINWQKKEVIVESDSREAKTIMLREGADTAEGEDFLRIVSPKLAGLHAYVHQMISEGEYDEANWTIELRVDDRNKDVGRRSQAIERKYGLVEPSPEYLGQRRELEASKPVTARFTKTSLREMVLRVIHRR